MQESSANIPEVSVIVPIYNVAPYIKECVESLMNQTLKNIEFIFIDDASGDNSLEVLEETLKGYPERKEQIRIIKHSENKGISFTRQEGTDLAKGKWLIHCDSDDKVVAEAYEILLEKGENSQADIVVGSYSEFGNRKGERSFLQGSGEISSNDFISSISGARQPSIHGALWNKLIRRSLWKGVEFPKDISYCEDVYTLFSIVNRNPDIKVVVLDDIVYLYRQRENSLISRQSPMREKEIEELINLLKSLYRQNDTAFNNALDAKIIGLLYRLLFISGDIQKYSKKYAPYLKFTSKNKDLNLLEKIYLYSFLTDKIKSPIIKGCLAKSVKQTYHFLKRIKSK